MRAKLFTALFIGIFISPSISSQYLEDSVDDFSQSLKNFFREKPLYEKYADSAVNYASLVERQDIKYQVNSSKPFTGNFIKYVDDNIFCVEEAGTYKNGKLNGYLEGYDGCGVAYSYKMNFKKGLEHGKYQEWNEGMLSMEGQYDDGKLEGEWTGYEYGLKTWTEYFDNDELLYYLEYTYHQNGQLATKESFNADEKLNGVSETYHQNGQLASKISYKDGSINQVIEKYDYNGNPIN
jgi:antitoxin component YwqK of YwqJK toxin-antitoxin module